MSRKTTIYLILTILAIVVAVAARFVPQLGISPDRADFFGGLAFGLLIGFIFTWIADKS